MLYICKYCGKECKNNLGLSLHENRCLKNINRIYDLDADIFICKYCGKICKNKNALILHEIRCNMNPQKILVKPIRKTTSLIGYKWMHKNDKLAFVNSIDLDNYLSNGWLYGMCDITKLHISIAVKKNHSHASSRCKDPLKEYERKKKISNAMKGNTNWMYNKHHGNAKQGWYDNIHFDSTWELAFYLYYKDNNMNIKRNKTSYTYLYNNEVHKYIPDFITDEGIIEVKGRKDKKAKIKEELFPNIIIYDAEKMKPILQYIIEKYGKNFYTNFYIKK